MTAPIRMTSITITLPVPSRKLSPNARIHWAAKAKITKKARTAAYYACIEVLGKRASPSWGKSRYLVHAYFKTAAARDADNFMASLKGYIDGIADAGIVTNDRDLWPERPVFAKDAANPRIEITITPEEKEQTV